MACSGHQGALKTTEGTVGNYTETAPQTLTTQDHLFFLRCSCMSSCLCSWGDTHPVSPMVLPLVFLAVCCMNEDLWL